MQTANNTRTKDNVKQRGTTPTPCKLCLLRRGNWTLIHILINFKLRRVNRHFVNT